MNRRDWILLTGTAMAGCKQSTKPTPPKTDPKAPPKLQAGPFSIGVPEAWRTGAIVEKVPIRPLYTPEDWQAFQQDPMNILKPSWGCRPEHWAIRLPGALPAGIPYDKDDPGDNPTAPQILIHRTDQWDLAFSDGTSPTAGKQNTPQRLRQNMDSLPDFKGWSPCPAYMDASLNTFLPQRIEFEGGHGMRIINEWEIEANILRKGDLHYLFLGMSGDDSCQIIATFPIDLPGLPDPDKDREHLGFSIEHYEEFEKNHEAYSAASQKWLTEHQSEITPRLDELDGMMRSLVVKSWA